ncbi:MAG: MarR family transcriptional regulator [Chloroflexi bacterium]|nr:MarR family transcriptional regulator [Chloroflexota bacterium]
MKTVRRGGFLISKIHHLSGRIFARKLKEYQVEINPAQGRIMFVLWQEPGIAISDLAKKTSLGKSTLTSMLDRLEEMGYVTRVRSKEDRRRIMIQRTEKDKSWQDTYAQVSQDMDALYYDGFSESQIDEFEQYLERLLDNLAAVEANVE